MSRPGPGPAGHGGPGKPCEDEPGRALIAEIAEVIHIRPLVEESTGSSRAFGAAVHVARIHDQIMVATEIDVGDEILEPAEQGRVLHVAGDDRQVGIHDDAGPVEKTDKSGGRHHGL